MLGVAGPLLAVALTVAVPYPSAPGVPWTAADVRDLDRDLSASIAASPTLRGAHIGALVVTPSGEQLFAHEPDATIQPASTFKLLVGSVALDRLGPAYRFRTTMTSVPAAPGANAALIVHGGGDPLLRAADLDAAADAAQRAGVAGPVDLRIDTSHVPSGERKAPGWNIDDLLWYYAPVVNGLPYEENVLDGWLDPAPEIGAAPTLRLSPPFLATLLPAGACPGGSTLTTFTIRARTVAAGAASTVDAVPGRCGEIVLDGDVPQGHPTSVALAVEAPEELARLDLAAALARRGIAVAPPPAATADAPLPGIVDSVWPAVAGETTVWTHDGEPLAALLGDFWGPSDNLVGEQLFHELDAVAHQRPGTASGASTIEAEWLRGIGIDPAAVDIDDGSGLSQYDRITPRILVAILAHDWNGPQRDVVLAALPVAGVRGSMRAFARGTAAQGRVFAKTGSMMHVRGLAGYIATARHGTVIFALSIDDWMGNDDDLDAFRAAFCSRIVGQ